MIVALALLTGVAQAEVTRRPHGLQPFPGLAVVGAVHRVERVEVPEPAGAHGQPVSAPGGVAVDHGRRQVEVALSQLGHYQLGIVRHCRPRSPSSTTMAPFSTWAV